MPVRQALGLLFCLLFILQPERAPPKRTGMPLSEEDDDRLKQRYPGVLREGQMTGGPSALQTKETDQTERRHTE
jgi:hypothetical protein